MGERDFLARYHYSREYADEQARLCEQGERTDTYRGLSGAAWVAEAYSIAASDARVLVQTQGGFWQPVADTCQALAKHYQEMTSKELPE